MITEEARHQSDPRKRLEVLLFRLSLGILCVAAFSKLYTLKSHFRFLDYYDPLFLIKNRHLLLAVAGLELLCVLMMALTKKLWLRGLIITWFGLNFLLYHVALSLTGSALTCPCFGSVGAQLGLSPAEAQDATTAMVIFLITSGVYLFVRGNNALSPATDITPDHTPVAMPAGVPQPEA